MPNLAGNPQLNTIEMLNLMQFQHLLSLNFMNLAPPLIFGAAAAAQQANTNNEAGLNIAPNLGRSTASMSSVSSNASDIAVNANPIAAAQKVQLLQQQAAAVQQVNVVIILFHSTESLHSNSNSDKECEKNSNFHFHLEHLLAGDEQSKTCTHANH